MPMSTPDETAVEMVRRQQPCLNCGAPLLGEFCYQCGQPKKGMIRHLPGLIADFLDSALNLDTRTLRTLGPLLTKPGFLSNEYFAGRRTRYVTPLRLYLFMSVLAFLMVSIVTPVRDGRDNGFHVSVGDRSAPAEAGLAVTDAVAERQRAREGRAPETVPEADLVVTPDNPNPGRVSIFNTTPWHPVDNPVRVAWLGETGNAWLNTKVGMLIFNSIEANKHPAKFVAAMFSVAPQTLLMILPIFALLLKLFFIFKRRLYMEHLIVALHSHSFLCLAILLLVLLNQVASWTGTWPVVPWLVGLLVFAMSCWIPLYLLIAQKRIYRQGWLMTGFKFVCIGIVYTVLLSFGMVLNLFWALASL